MPPKGARLELDCKKGCFAKGLSGALIDIHPHSVTLQVPVLRWCPMPLRSHAQYESALNEASALLGAEAGTPEGNRLVRLSEAIEVWECGAGQKRIEGSADVFAVLDQNPVGTLPG